MYVAVVIAATCNNEQHQPAAVVLVVDGDGDFSAVVVAVCTVVVVAVAAVVVVASLWLPTTNSIGHEIAICCPATQPCNGLSKSGSGQQPNDQELLLLQVLLLACCWHAVGLFAWSIAVAVSSLLLLLVVHYFLPDYLFNC